MIKQAKFVTSVAATDKLPKFSVPEIAIAGRSNVGKSSFINFITGQSKLARTSQEPGRTRLLNFFEINKGEYFFVDLPGYGYARVARQEKAKWGDLIESYLKQSRNLINVFVLVDIRREPNEDDKLMLKYLYAYGIPFSVIATKADKLSRAQTQKNLSVIANAFGIGPKDIIVTSATAGTGKQEVYDRIDALIQNSRPNNE